MLRPLLSLACVFTVALACSAADVPSCDPVGTWKLSCTPPDGEPRHCLVAVCREGQALTGTYTADGSTRPVEAIAFDEGVLCVRVKGEFGGQSYRLTYSGRPTGDTLKGSVRWSYGFVGGSFDFEGERVAQDLAASR